MYLPFIIFSCNTLIIDNVKELCGDSQEGARKPDLLLLFISPNCHNEQKCFHFQLIQSQITKNLSSVTDYQWSINQSFKITSVNIKTTFMASLSSLARYPAGGIIIARTASSKFPLSSDLRSAIKS